ncbi:MAG: hypothetical protein JNL55_29930 [Steroidobacter sp.]|nr:hypothetical protein [Steroidobacter sp.]
MLSPEHILQTGFGFRASQTLLSAVELGLFTELGKGPRSHRQLRRTLGLSPRAIGKLLEPLVALGLLEREGDDIGAVYVNSRESGHFLNRNSPGYLGDLLLQSTHRKSFGRELSNVAALLLAERFDFASHGTVLDIGSSRGMLARTIAARHAHLCCTHIAIPTGATVESLPRADVMVTSMSLRRLDVSARSALIKRIYQALPPGGCLIAIERLISEDRRRGSPGPLAMLLGAESRRHPALSGSELDHWCRAAGFERTELLPLIGPLVAASFAR